MNFLYIHTHDSGRYLSPYGYNIPTPNLQKFAEESLLFRQAYCAAPTCSPSRVGLLSGMSPHTSNMLGLAHRGFHMDDYSKHMASYLRKQGYFTALSGVQHEAPDRNMIGYSAFIDGKEKGDVSNAEAVADFLENYDGAKPFFVSFGMQKTHREYPKDIGNINPNYVIPAFPMQDTAGNRLDMARYMRSAQIADDCFGTVINALKKSKFKEDTVVMFTTDHGIAMPYMKCNLYDTGIGVTMILNVPNSESNGKATDSLVSQVDVFPTVCELLGVEKPDWLQGTSLVPIINNTETEVRDEIFSEVTYHAAYEPKRCIRTKKYKLIKFYDNHNKQVLANIDESNPKREMMEAGLKTKPRQREMLFDLTLDATERENLVNNPKYADVYNDLSNRLENWMEKTNDPLLKYRHRVPAPENSVVNTINCTDPHEEDFE